MARAQETFGKKEREKKRLKKRKDKDAKRLLRKENNLKGAGLENMISYVDQFGNPTDTPPDLQNKSKIDASKIEISVAKKVEEEFDPIRKGRVAFFNTSKGYGFITDTDTQEKYFFHVNGLIDDVGDNDKVIFELEKGAKGMNAVRVKRG